MAQTKPARARRGVIRAVGHSAVALGYYGYGKPAGIVLRGFRRDFARNRRLTSQIGHVFRQIWERKLTVTVDDDRRIDVAEMIASHKARADAALASGSLSADDHRFVANLTPESAVRILAAQQLQGETRILWCWIAAAASVIAAVACAIAVRGQFGALGSAFFFLCLGANYAVRVILEQHDLPKRRGLKNT